MEDLSNMPMAKHSLNAGESMAAGNTTNLHAKEWSMTGPGSDPVDPLPPEGEGVQDDPTIQYTPMDKDPKVTVTSRNGRNSAYKPASVNWKAVK